MDPRTLVEETRHRQLQVEKLPRGVRLEGERYEPFLLLRVAKTNCGFELDHLHPFLTIHLAILFWLK